MQDKREPTPFEPESSAGYWINRASRLLLRRHEARLRPLGLGMSHLPVLLALEERGPLSQKELARLARVEQPTMAEMLLRMERDGLLQRQPNPEDKRGILISLSKSARQKLPKLKAALLEGEAEVNAPLSKKDQAALVELLKRIVTALEQGGA